MIISSRRSLLPRPQETVLSLTGVGLLGAFGISLVWVLSFLILRSIWGASGLLLFFVVAAMVVYSTQALQRRKLIAGRLDESICTFVRSFDYRNVDTRIIRAIYEEIQCELGERSFPYPVRASDTWENLWIADEDLEDIAVVVAQRTARSLSHPDQNPMYGRVKTVADLVFYLNHQPLLEHILPA